MRKNSFSRLFDTCIRSDHLKHKGDEGNNKCTRKYNNRSINIGCIANIFDHRKTSFQNIEIHWKTQKERQKLDNEPLYNT